MYSSVPQMVPSVRPTTSMTRRAPDVGDGELSQVPGVEMHAQKIAAKLPHPGADRQRFVEQSLAGVVLLKLAQAFEQPPHDGGEFARGRLLDRGQFRVSAVADFVALAVGSVANGRGLAVGPLAHLGHRPLGRVHLGPRVFRKFI